MAGRCARSFFERLPLLSRFPIADIYMYTHTHICIYMNVYILDFNRLLRVSAAPGSNVLDPGIHQETCRGALTHFCPPSPSLSLPLPTSKILTYFYNRVYIKINDLTSSPREQRLIKLHSEVPLQTTVWTNGRTDEPSRRGLRSSRNATCNLVDHDRLDWRA